MCNCIADSAYAKMDGMDDRYNKLSPFALAFAAEYRGFMKAAGVTGAQIAVKLGRNSGYVSERVNGKRALDTDDVDALAMLTPGWTGRTLMLELARRSRETNRLATITPLNVTGSRDDLAEVASDITIHKGDQDSDYDT